MKRVVEKIKENQIYKQLRTNYGYKTTAFAIIALAINCSFVIVNGATAIMYSSIWYGALAGYYVCLIALRCAIVSISYHYSKKQLPEHEVEQGKCKLYLLCGVLIIVLDLAMSVAIAQMVLGKRTTSAGEIYAITTAVYAFYKLTMAIINVVRAKKHGDLVAQSLVNINIADASITMVSLMSLMLVVFDSGSSTQDMNILKMYIGGAVALFVLGLGIWMIVKASKRLKER